MVKSRMSKIVGALLVILANSEVNAMEFSVSTALNMTSKYVNCQPRAKKIVELATRYVAAQESEKPALLAEMERQKKKLKKCEKKNREGSRKRFNVSNVVVGSTFNF